MWKGSFFQWNAFENSFLQNGGHFVSNSMCKCKSAVWLMLSPSFYPRPLLPKGCCRGLSVGFWNHKLLMAQSKVSRSRGLYSLNGKTSCCQISSIFEAAKLDIINIIHWNENVVVLMKSSSLAALKVVKMTTFSAASDENFIKMTTFPFQCIAL